MKLMTSIKPPRTIREVYDSLPEGTLAQLIENQLVMSPSPTYSHQDLLNKINFQMLLYLQEHPIGQVVLAPFDVHLGPENVFQPDILFVSKDHSDRIRQNGMHGAPDLVIELLSPSTTKYDQREKKKVYERSGVTEYWIVDPVTKDVEGYLLQDGIYCAPRKMTGQIDSELLGMKLGF